MELIKDMKLTVREDLEFLDDVVEDMLKFAGKEVTVDYVFFKNFNIKEDDCKWFWTKEMFKEFI